MVHGYRRAPGELKLSHPGSGTKSNRESVRRSMCAASLVLSPETHRIQRPQPRGDDAETERCGHAEAEQLQTTLHPRGCEIAEPVHHGVDEVLRLVTGFLFDHREADFPA